MTLPRTALPFLLLAVSILATGQDRDSPFRPPETSVKPSPAEKSQLAISAGDKVVDFDVWSTGPEAAILVKTASGAHKVLMWTIGEPQAQDAHFDIPADFEPRSIATHPQKRTVFLSGKRGAQYIIAIFEFKGQAWQGRTLYFSKVELRRLVLAPRPFATGYDEAKHVSIEAYRLFFAVRAADGSYGVRSVTDEGKREYEVVGPEPTKGVLEKDDDVPPESSAAPYALPSAFHPAGHILIWEDGQRCFHRLPYNGDNWGKPAPLLGGTACGGSLTVTPNGAGLIHWQPREAGVTIYLGRGKQKLQQATDTTFLSTPSSVPDGKGLVGLVQAPEGMALAYVPIVVPLADVVNAWMFTEGPADQELFSASSGLLRDLPHDQLYQLYDTEAYHCGGYDSSVPTRPYLVTTDLLWEVFGAAYEGTFVLQERQRAIPAFWALVGAVNAQAGLLPANSPWRTVLQTVSALRNPAASKDAEVARVMRAAGTATANFGKPLNYSDFKPRGHYTSNPEFANYFRAFRYLTAAAEKIDAAPLASLPASVKGAALNWISAYDNYIAPGRGPLVWRSGVKAPEYARHPAQKPAVFPLSWGFDNEALLSTVFHPDWPQAQQIRGPGGERVLASGLDVAAALGNNLARTLLADEIKKYPPLGAALDDLNHLWQANRAGKDLYSDWIAALAMQWANDVSMPGSSEPSKLWQAKRLQTGLASWTTLRHATVLVNERTMAECGENGFEALEMAPPRGYVEPDPKAFAAIAELFEHLAQVVSSSPMEWKGELPGSDLNDTPSQKSLRQGVLNRLKETAAKARLFEGIAEKELCGEALTNQEYEEILYVGRVAEHHFLIYKSLANKDVALSTPDPMPKTADVAAGPNARFVLQAAVGRPLEWDQVVPFFGRKEIVKGSVYSYYEFVSQAPLSDAEWLAKLKAHAHPEWIKPFISNKGLSCPAADPF